MIAKQYSIALPADYDMGIIRRRVDERGGRFDRFPGLYLKAFLIRERGRAGAVGNEYSPFYLWPETEALWDFVAGDGFRAIIDGFGRPAIRNWLTLGVETKPGLRSAEVQSATRSERALAPATDLIALRRDEIAANKAALADDPRIAARAAAVDVERWQLVRFTLWTSPVADLLIVPGTDNFEALRLSAPGLAAA